MNNQTKPTPQEVSKKTDRQRMIEMACQLDPKLKEFIEGGEYNKCMRLLSMAYLCFSIGQSYVEESVDLLEPYGLMHKKLKTRVTNLINCFDVYNKQMEEFMKGGGVKESNETHLQLCDDYEILRDTCDRFMNADIRIGRMDAINRDDLRSEAVYLCQVKDSLIAPVRCFKWNGEKWLEFVKTPFPKWTETDQTITYVIDRVKTVEE